MFDLKGKVAVVTGGAMGIGAAIATVLAENGARVAIADLNLEAAEKMAEAIRTAGGAAQAFTCDVTNWNSVFALAADVEEKLAPIDILVNNAGVSRRMPLVAMTEQEWDRMLDINLKGQFLATRAIAPGMLERKRGRIVNLASVTAKRGFPAFSHYCASKFGVMGLTQSLAMEFAPFDVTVNAVCPGILMTPLHDGIIQDMADAAHTTIEQAKTDFVGFIPLKRAQEPREVANMVAYLVSDFGRNMTGGTYHVDGGMVMD